MPDAHMGWFLPACSGLAVALATGGCGGKLLGGPPEGGDVPAPSPIEDAAPLPFDGAGSPKIEYDGDTWTGRSDAMVKDLDGSLSDRGEVGAPVTPSIGAAFWASCSAYSGVVGRASCEGCVSRAQAHPTCSRFAGPRLLAF